MKEQTPPQSAPLASVNGESQANYLASLYLAGNTSKLLGSPKALSTAFNWKQLLKHQVVPGYCDNLKDCTLKRVMGNQQPTP
jgi:hypothetical protein